VIEAKLNGSENDQALGSILKANGEDRCPICGEVIVPGGVERHGKLAAGWHADFYRPPPGVGLRWPMLRRRRRQAVG
jgi:hypothetical protein